MIRFLVVLTLAFAIGEARAHDPGMSSATVDLATHDILVQCVFAPADLAALTLRDSANLAAQCVELRSATSILAATSTERRALGPDNVEFTLRFPRPEGSITFRSQLLAALPFGHRQIFTLRDEAGATTATELLSAAHDTAQLPAPARQPERSMPPLVAWIIPAALAAILATWLFGQRRAVTAAP